MRPRTQVFEYQSLHIGEGGMTTRVFDQLVKYNEVHGCKYFDVGHRKIRFKNYVGVIQVGRVVIEILPKADAARTPDKAKWQRALIEMLRRSGTLKLDSLTKATLSLKNASLLDLYIESFLKQARLLSREGLIRRYRRNQDNLSYFKGKLLLSRHIDENLLHKERFFTEHTVYDQDNIFNRMLKAALSILVRTGNPVHAAEANALLLSFENVSAQTFRDESFIRLAYDRNTERYRDAIQLARLIILDYLPDVRYGEDNLLAILFDMNALFERFVLAEMRRAQRHFPKHAVNITGQKSSRFWGNKTLRPDILVEYEMDGATTGVILDTKWKALDVPSPADDDLKQMYCYNMQFGTHRAVLVYPRVFCSKATSATFAKGKVSENFAHGCGLEFVDLFDDQGHLRSDLGESLIRSLVI